jgi:hypothetical protein
MKIFLISLVCFFTISVGNIVNYNTAFADDSNYEYLESGRKNKKDPDYPSDFIGQMENVPAVQAAKEVIALIPGLNIVVSTLEFVAKVIYITDLGSIKNVADAFSKLMSLAANILDPLSSDRVSSDMGIVIQSSFGVNLYCTHQRIYKEEKGLLNKSDEPKDSGSNYPMFPIYPLDIGINSVGQCNIDDNFLNKNFINPANATGIDVLGVSFSTESMSTKCSYAHSPSDEQCMSDYTIPYYTTLNTILLHAEIQCSTTQSVALGGGSGVALRIITNITGFFMDERLILDPISFIELNIVEFMTFWFFIDYIHPLGAINPFKCLDTTRLLQIGLTVDALKVSFANQRKMAHEDAKDAIKKYTFCGYNWLSYTKTDDKKYWKRGMYDHSYYKTVSDCIRGELGSCVITDNNVACNEPNDSKFCKGITPTSADIKNKIFREFIYGGKEYTAGKVEVNIKDDDNRKAAITYHSESCIDPRLPETKGYRDVMQRYYMKGNEKANFACTRFFYDRTSGCMLRDVDVDSADRVNLEAISAGNTPYYIIPDTDKTLINKYSKKCDDSFREARECCRHRSKHLVCLENKTNGTSTFCMSNVIDGERDNTENLNMIHYIRNLNSDLNKATCEIEGVTFEASKKKGTEHVCVFSHGFCPYNFKLNAGLNYRASYCDANYFANYEDPSSILKRGRTHYNVDDCKKGLFGADYRKEYKDLFATGSVKGASYTFDKVANDMKGYNDNDFETIYDFLKLTDEVRESDSDPAKKLKIQNLLNCGDLSTCNDKVMSMKSDGYKKINASANSNLGGMVSSDTVIIERYSINTSIAQQIKTSAYGQIKNFCQYRAHCTEVEAERESTYLYELNSAVFLDPSCGGNSNNSRHILQTYGFGISRQLSAPVVECIFESLKNLINGVAGNSLCDIGYDRNNEGYCGIDTKEEVEKHFKANDVLFFEGKYQKYGDRFVVKGYSMPDSANPFLVIQKSLLNIIRAALSLFIVIFFHKQLITGKINSFVKADNMPKLVLTVFKFTVVMYLIFNNGWQKGIYERLVKFSMAGYTFVNGIFSKIAQKSNKSNTKFRWQHCIGRKK